MLPILHYEPNFSVHFGINYEVIGFCVSLVFTRENTFENAFTSYNFDQLLSINVNVPIETYLAA